MTTRSRLTGAKIFDGTRFLDEPRDVLVEDGRVSLIPASAHEPAGTDVVDLTGSTLTPGIIDTHVHLPIEGSTAMSAFAEPFSIPFYRTVANLRKMLDIGITTVRDAGGSDAGTRQAVASGIIEGPRLTVSTAIMSQTGGHGDLWLPSGHTHPMLKVYPGMPSGIADGIDGVRVRAREILRAGADHIKICATGGILSPGDDPEHAQFTEDEIRVIVEEAEEQGKYVLAHAQGAKGIARALRAGVRSIEHGVFVDDESIQLLLDGGGFLVPTLLATQQIFDAEAAGVTFAPGIMEKAHHAQDEHVANIKRAYDAGVKIAMGTDAGVGEHGHNLGELALMCDLGMSIPDSLAASTSVAAELMRIDDLGVVRDGAIADLAVFAGDLEQRGLADLTGRVEQVWQAGVRVR